MFLPYLHSSGIQPRFTCPYTYHQNGIAKHKHRHIVEMGLTLLSHSHMPLKFWIEAFQIVVYTINLLPSSALKFQILFEVLFHKQPNYLMLQPFGCTCFPYLHPYNKHKFEFHSTKCVFIGYSHTQAGYKCLHPSGRIYVSQHVQFNPDNFPYISLFSSNSISKSCSPSFSTSYFESIPLSTSSGVAQPESSSLSNSISSQSTRSLSNQISDSLINPQPISSLSIPQPCSQPIPHESKYTAPPHPMLTRSNAKQLQLTSPHALTNSLVPSSIHEAFLDASWVKAMIAKFTALKQNGTWELVPYSNSMNLIGCKWVYRVKYNPNGDQFSNSRLN